MTNVIENAEQFSGNVILARRDKNICIPYHLVSPNNHSFSQICELVILLLFIVAVVVVLALAVVVNVQLYQQQQQQLQTLVVVVVGEVVGIVVVVATAVVVYGWQLYKYRNDISFFLNQFLISRGVLWKHICSKIQMAMQFGITLCI